VQQKSISYSFMSSYLRKYKALHVSAFAMLASVSFLALLAAAEGFFASLPRFTPAGWLAVLFIGASSGLGKAIAARFVASGANAIIVARREELATFVDAMVLFKLGIETGDGVEIQALLGVIEGLTQKQIPALLCRNIRSPDSDGGTEAKQHEIAAGHGLTVFECDIVIGAEQPDFEQSRPFILGEGMRRALAKAIGTSQCDFQLVLTRPQIAVVNALHATVLQGLQLLVGVNVVRHVPAIEANVHRVQTNSPAPNDRNEQGDLGVGGIKQFLFQLQKFGGDGEHILFDVLHLLIQSLDLLSGYVTGGDSHLHRQQHCQQ
jgi:hypothetical protein